MAFSTWAWTFTRWASYAETATTVDSTANSAITRGINLFKLILVKLMVFVLLF
jgi:hypothetical protein